MPELNAEWSYQRVFRIKDLNYSLVGMVSGVSCCLWSRDAEARL